MTFSTDEDEPTELRAVTSPVPDFSGSDSGGHDDNDGVDDEDQLIQELPQEVTTEASSSVSTTTKNRVSNPRAANHKPLTAMVPPTRASPFKRLAICLDKAPPDAEEEKKGSTKKPRTTKKK